MTLPSKKRAKILMQSATSTSTTTASNQATATESSSLPVATKHSENDNGNMNNGDVSSVIRIPKEKLFQYVKPKSKHTAPLRQETSGTMAAPKRMISSKHSAPLKQRRTYIDTSISASDSSASSGSSDEEDIVQTRSKSKIALHSIWATAVSSLTSFWAVDGGDDEYMNSSHLHNASSTFMHNQSPRIKAH
jgi:hypothetical protein